MDAFVRVSNPRDLQSELQHEPSLLPTPELTKGTPQMRRLHYLLLQLV